MVKSNFSGMKRVLLILLIFILAFNAEASRSLSFVKYQVDNGLSHNTVWCALQDSYDLMWFGTSDGLNCFDGKDFRIFRNNPKDKYSIGNNFVRSLLEDKEQNIWVGTNIGLYVFNRKTETFLLFDQKTEDGVLISSNVNKIIESVSGDLWIATSGQGVFIYKPATRELVQNSIYTSFVRDLEEIPDGDIFATSRENGLIRFNQDGKYLQSYLPFDKMDEVSSIEIVALCYMNDKLWFGVGPDEFYKLDLKTGEMNSVIKKSSSGNVSNIRSVFPVSENELWLGGGNGLYLFNTESQQLSRIDNPANPKSLSDQSVYDIIRDREGGLWVSTYFGGVNYIPQNTKPFEHYFPLNQKGSISGKVISQFCEDDNGNIWIGTEDSGLNLFNTRSLQFVNFQSFAGAGNIVDDDNSIGYSNIHALLLDGDKLWIGTFSRGIDVFDLKRRSIKNYQYRRYDLKSVCSNSINIIYKDSRDNIYVGTDWGLSLYDRVSDSFTLVEEIGGQSHVFDILEDSLGYIWVATYNTGLFCFNSDKKIWVHYINVPGDSLSLCSNSVISLFEDVSHTMWFGTEGGGLCSFDRASRSFVQFDPEGNLLPDQVIKAIEQDEFGNLWISTNDGLIQINPKNTNERRVFTKADGLQSNQFNFRSSLRASDGKIYFGGVNGFNAFYPKDFSENKFIPRVIINDFRLFNKQVSVSEMGSPLTAPVYDTKEIKLKHNMNTFSFKFVALSYQAPDKNRYVYFMEGVDKDWNVVENPDNTAYYTNLPSGNYKFRVKGSNNDGVWNQEETVITVRILPPLWKSGFAYVFYIVILIVIFAWVYRLRVNRLALAHSASLRMFQEKQEKKSYLSKINFFTNIAHEIRTPLTLIKLPLERIIESSDGNEKTKGYLETIKNNTDYLLNLINQLLDFRKTEEVEEILHIRMYNVSKLLRDIYTRFYHSADIINVNLSVSLPENDLLCGVDIEVFNKVVSNLMSNALKYARSRIEIKLVVLDLSFEVWISDDGKGVNPHESSKIFEAFYQSDNSEPGTGIGLAYAKVLTEKHHGSLRYDNNVSDGSTFIISLSRLNIDEPVILSSEGENIVTAPEYSTGLLKIDSKSVKSESALKLLLVEDNKELLKLTAGYLNDFYQVSVALNGKEALSLMAEYSFDIVVSDLMMPEMDGYQLCEAIKTDIRYCHIPFIMLTAKTTVDDKIMGLEYGSDAYLEKPFSFEHLRTQVKNLLASRQQLRELFSSSPLFHVNDIAVAQRDKDFLERLNADIEKHMADVSFSIDTLAENMNMSRSNFYRKIRSVSGMPPNDYLKIIRLRRAAELLLKQEYRINEVYEQTGFNSSSYFAKCFKEQFGMLPREFVLKAGEGAL